MAQAASKQKRRVRVAPNLYQRPADKKFEAGLTIEGRWQMTTLQAQTKQQALLELAQLRVEAAERATLAQRPRASVAAIAEAWLNSFALQVERGERSIRTLDYYRSNYRCHVEAYFGSQRVDEVGPDEIVGFYDSLRADGKTAHVVRACSDVLSRIFKFAIRRGYLETSPLAKLEPSERPRPAAREQRILTHAEIEALLAAAEGDAHDLIALHLYTGMRQGEILGLTWDCIDFERGLVHVRKQLQRPRNGVAQAERVKTPASVRDVILLPQLAALLRRRKLASSFSGADDFLFSRGPGVPIHYSRANRLLRAATTRAGIEHVRSHDFRHTYASHLIVDLRLDVAQVQRQLGHAKPSITTDKYLHLFEQSRHDEELRRRMAESAFGNLLAR